MHLLYVNFLRLLAREPFLHLPPSNCPLLPTLKLSGRRDSRFALAGVHRWNKAYELNPSGIPSAFHLPPSTCRKACPLRRSYLPTAPKPVSFENRAPRGFVGIGWGSGYYLSLLKKSSELPILSLTYESTKKA